MTDQALLQANKELIRAYTRDVFNAHKPERAAEFLALNKRRLARC